MIDSQQLHQTVLLDAAVDALEVEQGGIYIDGTFGRGGHSKEILKRLNGQGSLLAFDKDPEAIAFGKQQFQHNEQLHLVATGFENMSQVAREHDVFSKVMGILLDLGVSSPQLDDAQRGFSFMQNGPLDMRMDTTSGISAAQWLAEAEESEIADVLWTYGEERFSRQIARAIVQDRDDAPFTETAQLASLIERVVRKKEKNKHPATRSFQAIRIFINNELGVLEGVLQQALDCLAVGGRLAVISFHSLEDRIVKRFFQLHGKQQPVNRHLPPVEQDELKITIIGKAIKPSAAEIELNPRARSAVMRIAQKVAA